MPGRRDHQKNDAAREKPHLEQMPQVAGHHQKYENNRARENDPNQTLGEHIQRYGGGQPPTR